MEECSLRKTSVLLLDSYNEEGKMLYQSFTQAGFKGLILCCSDDAFLPEDVLSIYTIFLGKKKEDHDTLMKLTYQIIGK